MTTPRSKRRLFLVSLAILLLLILAAGATLAVVLCASNDARESSELADDDDWEEHLTFRQRMTRIKVGFLFLWYDTKEAISRKLSGESVEVPPPTVQFEAEPEPDEPDEPDEADEAEPSSAGSSDPAEHPAQD